MQVYCHAPVPYQCTEAVYVRTTFAVRHLHQLTDSLLLSARCCGQQLVDKQLSCGNSWFWFVLLLGCFLRIGESFVGGSRLAIILGVQTVTGCSSGWWGIEFKPVPIFDVKFSTLLMFLSTRLGPIQLGYCIPQIPSYAHSIAVVWSSRLNYRVLSSWGFLIIYHL
jgi:hypothetical protein